MICQMVQVEDWKNYSLVFMKEKKEDNQYKFKKAMAIAIGLTEWRGLLLGQATT